MSEPSKAALSAAQQIYDSITEKSVRAARGPQGTRIIISICQEQTSRIIDVAMEPERKAADELAEVVAGLLDDANGCAFCDFGILRNARKMHAEDCLFPKGLAALAAYKAARGHAPDCPVITEWDAHWGYGNKDIGCVQTPPICKCGFDAAIGGVK